MTTRIDLHPAVLALAQRQDVYLANLPAGSTIRGLSHTSILVDVNTNHHPTPLTPPTPQAHP